MAMGDAAVPRHSVDAPTQPRCVGTHGLRFRNRVTGAAPRDALALLVLPERASAADAEPSAATRRGCRVNPAWRVATVEISNEPAVSVLGVTAQRDGWAQLIVAVGDIHTAESFPDSLRRKR
jgi:hypothetical protein